MALTLTKEDGTGKVDANCYADVADCNAYHDGHVYAGAWTSCPSEPKEQSLVMATRLIDAYYQFGGRKATAVQALQWPRVGCVDRDSGAGVFMLGARPACFPSDAVPAVVVAATCELARELIVADRTANPLGEGLRSNRLGDSTVVFDKRDRPPVISHVAQALLGKVGTYLGRGSGAVPLTRV
jgi:hypothetical protein